MGIREYGYVVGNGATGSGNQITDIPGVRVGHCTISEEDAKTGVTVVLPCEGLIYERKPVAASYVVNGYGKTMGTIQIDELGTLETPIALTNTLNVGKVADALVEYTIQECNQKGLEVRSVNPVVGETNDSKINKITRRAVDERHVFEAIQTASVSFEQGAVGAGRGTVCYDLKGGIGSASRRLRFCGRDYIVGALVQSNFGSMKDLIVCGNAIGKDISQKLRALETEERGSVMVVIGTDIPLSARQLRRVLKRAVVGLIRTGSHMGHGSGDIFLGFTNGNYMPDAGNLLPLMCFPENHIERIFRLAAEAVEEAVLNSMLYAEPERGRNGEMYHSLSEFLKNKKACLHF